MSMTSSPARTYSASSNEWTWSASQPPGASAPTASSVCTAPCFGPTMTDRARPLDVADVGCGVSANDQSTRPTWCISPLLVTGPRPGECAATLNVESTGPGVCRTAAEDEPDGVHWLRTVVR